nr:MAG TPA: hypothetical protein [Bacteriophage sp.]
MTIYLKLGNLPLTLPISRYIITLVNKIYRQNEPQPRQTSSLLRFSYGYFATPISL